MRKKIKSRIKMKSGWIVLASERQNREPLSLAPRIVEEFDAEDAVLVLILILILLLLLLLFLILVLILILILPAFQSIPLFSKPRRARCKQKRKSRARL